MGTVELVAGATAAPDEIASCGHPLPGLRMALLDDWQRGFPLQRSPFARIGAALGLAETAVIGAYRALADAGMVSRIGGVFAAQAGGAGALAAMAVPRERLEAVAALVSAHPAVNHNYEREHDWNLWFVVHGVDEADVNRVLDTLQAGAEVPLQRMAMQRAYRIDLGFSLRDRVGRVPGAARAAAQAPAVAPGDQALAALVEQGLPLVERPFDRWARALGWTIEDVLTTLERWLQQGTLKRFGVIVRHHELGFGANAMTVFDVPDHAVDACGEALAREPGVSLAYRRARAPGWPYNLYCMVHGRDRAAACAALAGAMVRAGLNGLPHEVLFSRRRFKQEGARRFRAMQARPMDPPGATPPPLPRDTEARHAA